MRNLLLLAFSLFFITYSNAQWKYVNPDPFSFDINASFFISDSIGWVAGQDGIIQKTTDAGKSWKRQITNLPVSYHLNSICFVNKDTGWTVGLVGRILKTTDGGDHWLPQTSGSDKWLYSVSFVSANTGYALGLNGTVLKTTNGGLNWTLSASSHGGVYSSQFLSENLGYAVCSIDAVPFALKTTDGGISWNKILVDSNKFGDLHSCCFVDSSTGWVVGSNGLAYKTVDGGSSWSKCVPDSIAQQNYNYVIFKDTLTGCIAAANSDSILVTKDGGQNWERISLLSKYNITNLFYSQNRLYASGSAGLLLYSTDSGEHWIALSKDVTLSNIQTASFIDSHNIWAAGNSGVIIKSTDGGNTWLNQISNTTQNLNTICFFDSLNGFVCSYQGTILKTSNGGENWNKLIDSSALSLYSMFFLDKNIGFCGGYDRFNHAVFLKTVDGGIKWTYLTNTPNDYWIEAIYFKDSLNGWAGGSSLNRTTDGGKTWIVQLNLSSGIYKIQFVDALHGWMLSAGEIYKTFDGGLSWVKYMSQQATAYSCWFINENEGWKCGVGGNIFYTSNAGQTWTQQSGSNPDLNYIAFNGGTGLAFGNGGAILKTTNGGISFINDKTNSVQKTEYYLSQNYPNPFNPVTTISYSINKSSHVTIRVYDIIGKEISILVNEFKSPGVHKINFDGSRLSSGIYFYTLQVNENSITKKLVIMK